MTWLSMLKIQENMHTTEKLRIFIRFEEIRITKKSVVQLELIVATKTKGKPGINLTKRCLKTVCRKV